MDPRQDAHARAIRALPRADSEALYLEAFRRDDKEALRWLAQVDRYFLLTCLLGRVDARNDWIYARCREVEADPDDHLDLWAREHYKSTIITFAGIIQEVLIDPEITICIFSHDKPAAKDFLQQIKIELEDNELLKALFPNILYQRPAREAPWWGLDTGLVVRRKGNPKEATIEVSGLIDGMSTGKHFRLRVYDDIVTEETVTTAEMIRKVTAQWELSENLGTRDGRVWMIGTRYHFGDTYGILIKRGVHERRYAATHDGTFEGHPVFLTVKQWERKKARESKSTIAAQQLLNPLAGSETKFDIRWLKFWTIRPKRLNVYILMDPSKGKTATSDNTAMAVIGVDVANNKYLLDGCRHRMSLSKRWETLRNAYRRWTRIPGIEAVMVGYEQFGMQTDIEYFEEKMVLEDVSFPIEELKWPRSGPKSKEHRIERLEPDFRMGRFRLPYCIDIDEEGNVTPIDPSKEREAIECIRRNERYRVATPIRKRDEDNHVYDLINGFLEEYMFFPFNTLNDFLDACSRIYDMDLAPPIHYEPETGRPMSTTPEIYPDT